MTIYVASKTYHAPWWRALRAAGVPIIATWIDEPDPCDNYPALWQRCIQEAAHAAVTLVYAAPGEVLKGGLIECGAALSAGKRIVQVGTCASLEIGDGSDASFTHHGRWYRAKDIEAGIKWALCAARWRPDVDGD